MKSIYTIVACALFYMLPVTQANAAIYKCVSVSKGVYYIDKPCPKVDEETKINSVKDPKNGYTPAPFVKDEVVEKSNDGVVVGKSLVSEGSLEKTNDKEGSLLQKDPSEKSSSTSSTTGGGGGIAVDPNSPSQEGSEGQNNSTGIIAEVQPGEGEPLNVDELIRRQGPPKE